MLPPRPLAFYSERGDDVGAALGFLGFGFATEGAQCISSILPEVGIGWAQLRGVNCNGPSGLPRPTPPGIPSQMWISLRCASW